MLGLLAQVAEQAINLSGIGASIGAAIAAIGAGIGIGKSVAPPWKPLPVSPRQPATSEAT